MIDEAAAAVLRAKTPAQRLAMGFAANRTARMLIAAGIRRDHPDWTDEQIKVEVARRMMGEAAYVMLAAKGNRSPSPRRRGGPVSECGVRFQRAGLLRSAQSSEPNASASK